MSLWRDCDAVQAKRNGICLRRYVTRIDDITKVGMLTEFLQKADEKKNKEELRSEPAAREKHPTRHHVRSNASPFTFSTSPVSQG